MMMITSTTSHSLLLDVLPHDVLQQIIDTTASLPSTTCITPLQTLAHLSLTCKTFRHLIHTAPCNRHRMNDQERQHALLRQALLHPAPKDDLVITRETNHDIVIKLTFQTHLQLIQRYRLCPEKKKHCLIGLTGRLAIPHPTQPNSHITMIYPDELDSAVSDTTELLLTILAPSRVKHEHLLSLFTRLHQFASLVHRHGDELSLPQLQNPSAFLSTFQAAFLAWKQQNIRRIYNKHGFVPQTFKSTKHTYNNHRVFTNRQGATFIKHTVTKAPPYMQPFANLFAPSKFSRIVMSTSI